MIQQPPAHAAARLTTSSCKHLDSSACLPLSMLEALQERILHMFCREAPQSDAAPQARSSATPAFTSLAAGLQIGKQALAQTHRFMEGTAPCDCQAEVATESVPAPAWATFVQLLSQSPVQPHSFQQRLISVSDGLVEYCCLIVMHVMHW